MCKIAKKKNLLPLYLSLGGWGGGRNVTQEKRKVPGSYQAKRATTDNPRDGSRKINGMNMLQLDLPMWNTT